MKPVCLLLATLLVAPLALGPARTAVAAEDAAAAKGAKILKISDERAAAYPNQTYVATMDLYVPEKDVNGPLKKTKTMVFNMVMKDLEKQYINFTAPGDVAGMKVLMTDADTIYIYSPEFQKVRRVAAHTQSQGFLGSEFTPEDMKMAKLSPNFDAVVGGKVGNETTLTLTPKKEGVTSYAKLEIVIDSTVGGITKIRYFDGSGAAVREQTRGKWTTYEGTMMPTEVRMKNLKTGHETVITLSEIDVKTPIADDIFSRRTLMRG